MNELIKAVQQGQAYLKANDLKVERNRVCPIDGEVLSVLNDYGQPATCAYKDGKPFLFGEYNRSQFCSPEKMAADGFIPLGNIHDLESPWIPKSYLVKEDK